MFCGVDEAGRGPVMGPLVVGCVFVEDDSTLMDIGVKDSKKLTPRARERMYDSITDSVPFWTTVMCSAEDIDAYRKQMSLNELEMRMFAEAVNGNGADTVYIDCPEVNTSGFEARMRVLCPGSEIIARNKADDLYPVVSAASIIAKVTRDRMMDEIRKEFDVNIGSGYPSDHYTMDFIRGWIEENGRPPKHTRSSWEPIREMLSKRANTKITDW